MVRSAKRGVIPFFWLANRRPTGRYIDRSAGLKACATRIVCVLRSSFFVLSRVA
jgi:hypothetical protein